MTLTDPNAKEGSAELREKANNEKRESKASTSGGSLDEKSPNDVVIEQDGPAGAVDEDESKYPTGLALGLITLALCLAVFLVALDQTIIATAIPKITDQFHALDDVGWYGSAYMLTMCSFQLIYGKIYTFFSLKWCFLGAIGVFELGSLICGVAPSSEALIVGRAIQGLGASGIFSGALVILAHSVPLRKRPAYTGAIGGMFGIASVAGPLLGGVFTDHVTWRLCFYINLPIGLITIVGIMVYFKPPNREKNNLTFNEKMAEFDFIGTGLLLPGIVCLLLALQWGGSKYAWKSGHIIGLLCTFGVLIIGFIIVQIKSGEKATLPLRIIGQRSITFGSMVSFCVGSGFLLLVFFVPIWFQAIGGVTATQSGIRNIPLVLGVTFLSVIGGIGMTIIGQYVPFVMAGGVLMSIGAGLITTFKVDTPSSQWIGYQILAGAGVGLMIQVPMIAAQTVLKMEDVPTGVAAIVFAQSLGGALFISVGNNVFSNELIKGILKVAPNVTAAQILQTGATSIRQSTLFTAEQLPKVIEAYNDALVRCYYVAVAMAVLGFLATLRMEWASVKGKKLEMAAA
ncbi:major facilitator superfamily domain-containing protein [Peziza echinospora]|nr:major facilitator superfamily domain-containing protein [Peziza echinospora]